MKSEVGLAAPGKPSGIGNQPRKSFVHVILMMAMEKGRAGVIGDEVDLGF
jgi:hypothetical protein